ncbi:MAG: hypothetical protein WC541_00940 [Dehalococcoidia bacterium]
MKGVGIDLPQSDFEDMKNAGIEILSTEWGMEQDIDQARRFLDQAQAAGLKVVMDGGFSYTAWGFSDDDWEGSPAGKRPVWKKERVQNWINALKDHSAIYAWDICNEFGENLPSGAGIPGSDWPKTMITLEQLKQARADVLAVDNTRPIHLRTYEWESNDRTAFIQSMLDAGIADIISLNLYSNYLDHGKLQWPDVIADAGQRCVTEIKQRAPQTKVWLSIAAFEDDDIFQQPTTSDVARDIKYAREIEGLDGLSFFCWGPVNQWDERNNWYLPRTGADLWSVIKEKIGKAGQ